MSDTKPLFDTLRNSADPNVVAAIEAVIRDGSDRKLCRINILNFAAEHGLDEEKAISGFLHAARLGPVRIELERPLPGLRWRARRQRKLSSPCTRRPTTARSVACGYEPTLDEMVEVAFTVSPRVRRIAAHDPHLLPIWEYFRQIFWGSGVDLPEDRTWPRDARGHSPSMRSRSGRARRRICR